MKHFKSIKKKQILLGIVGLGILVIMLALSRTIGRGEIGKRSAEGTASSRTPGLPAGTGDISRREHDRLRSALRSGSHAASTSRILALSAQLKDPNLSSEERNILQIRLAEIYADVDPVAGAAWLNKLDVSAGNLPGIAAIFGSGLGKNNFESWKEVYSLLSPGFQQAFALGVFRGLGINDTEGAWKVFQSESTQNAKLKEIEGPLMKQLAKQNPDVFWHTITERLNTLPDEEQASSEIRIFFQYASFTYPNNAIAALSSVGDGDLKKNCVEDYVSGLQEDKLFEFSESVAKSDADSGFKDLAIAKAVSYLYYKNPGNAARLIGLIRDPGLRDEARNTLLRYAQSKGSELKSSVLDVLSEKNAD